MKEAIKEYFEKLKEYPDYYKNEDFSEVCDEIKSRFRNGIIPIERNVKTDIALFEKEFGYRLPDEIADYINTYWHPYISGYLSASECIVLFSVLKRTGDTENDILYYNNCLITMSKEWAKLGDINSYIPIGWLSYSGGYVLYEVEGGRIFLEDIDADDGDVADKPIADSLKALIKSVYIRR